MTQRPLPSIVQLLHVDHFVPWNRVSNEAGRTFGNTLMQKVGVAAEIPELVFLWK